MDGTAVFDVLLVWRWIKMFRIIVLVLIDPVAPVFDSAILGILPYEGWMVLPIGYWLPHCSFVVVFVAVAVVSTLYLFLPFVLRMITMFRV